jgi:hypothetical protein
MASAHARDLDEEELADWRAGRNAVYQLAALTIGVRLGVADAYSRGRFRSAVASAHPIVSPAPISRVKSSASGAMVTGVFTRRSATPSQKR